MKIVRTIVFIFFLQKKRNEQVVVIAKILNVEQKFEAIPCQS